MLLGIRSGNVINVFHLKQKHSKISKMKTKKTEENHTTVGKEAIENTFKKRGKKLQINHGVCYRGI